VPLGEERVRTVKWIVGLLLGVIAIGVLVVVAVVALFVPVRSEVVASGGYAMIESTLTADARTDQLAIELTWSGLDHDGTAYELIRSSESESGQWMVIAVIEPDSVGYRDEDVEAGETYVYRIRATDRDGVARVSALASATAGYR
jgi:hypothetical protein